MLNKNKISVIGSGFAGLSAAIELASRGVEVDVFEKNSTAGGRARQFRSAGFNFDMGPSWYWMPDVIERFFNRHGRTVSEYFELKKLDPGFQMIFDKEDVIQIPSNADDLVELFDEIEQGAGDKLLKFLSSARYKYEVGMQSLVYQPGLSLLEYMNLNVVSGLFRLQLFSSFKSYVAKYFKSPKIRNLMEFPVLFLGAMPESTPALYSLMNYAGLSMGTYYPMGGFGQLIDALRLMAVEKGVKFHFDEAVTRIDIKNKSVRSLLTGKNEYPVEGLIGAGDYHHIENELIPPEYRNYSKKYWDKRVMAPSSLIFYLGVNQKLNRLIHHNLFFIQDLDTHAREIYVDPKWPSKPLFYVCCPSKTDYSVAPEGSENLFILMPIAPGLEDSDQLRERYFKLLISELELFTGQDIRNHLVFKRSYCINDFKSDYNAFKGNAYGLANTLGQTAIFKPKLINKKIKNLLYAGQLTVPGPGVPPSIISGEVAAKQLIKQLKPVNYESTI